MVDLDDRIDALIEEAGDDINKQIRNAQEITDLMNTAEQSSDATICAALQKRASVPTLPEVVERAGELLESTCPGDLDALSVEPGVIERLPVIDDRSIYGLLDLGTPEAAVETFVAAGSEGAFLPVFLTFDHRTQTRIAQGFVNGDHHLPIAATGEEILAGILSPADTTQHAETMALVFARVMADAAAAGELDHLGFAEEGTVTQVESDHDDPGIAVVERTTSLGALEFLLAESPSGRWRVVQVVNAGSGFGGLDPLPDR